jgi:hypothetical protein
MWAMWGKIVRIKKNQEFEELKTNNSMNWEKVEVKK